MQIDISHLHSFIAQKLRAGLIRHLSSYKTALANHLLLSYKSCGRSSEFKQGGFPMEKFLLDILAMVIAGLIVAFVANLFINK